MLSVGIVGLPNVGKSTLFNAVTAAGADVSNYPFTTIDPNIGVVEVPDERLQRLAELLRPQKVTPSTVSLIDIAGLVEGASRGEGLGNRFLGEIRAVDAVAHVVRCFHDPDVAHVFAAPDPVRDAEIVETELILADLDILGRVMERRSRDWQTHPREHDEERSRLERWKETLESGRPLRALDPDPATLDEQKGLGLLTGKPLLLVANADEEPTAADDDVVALRRRFPASEVVPLSARLEWELVQLDPADRAEFLAELDMEEPGLDRLVTAAFRLLGLITFYTVAKDKLQAWAIPRRTRAPQAAGRVHTDMERGFIRAQAVSFDDLMACGSLAHARESGRLRTEGRSYEIADGDVVEFLFNVS